MTAENIIEGLQLIQKSKPEGKSGYYVRADHDVIWAGSLEWKMSKEDKKRMKELGWDRDNDADGWRAYV